MDFHYCHRHLTMDFFASQEKGCEACAGARLDDGYNHTDCAIPRITDISLRGAAIWVQTPRQSDGLVHDNHRDY